jgi:hypothetical protein
MGSNFFSTLGIFWTLFLDSPRVHATPWFFYIFLRLARTWNMPKTWNFFCNQSKNGIYRVKALDELIIFAIHHNFPKRLFRAVEAVKVGGNMQKMTFFLFQLGMGYGVRKMTARIRRVFLLLRSTLPDPYPPRYGFFSGSKWPKIIENFCFRV